MCPPHALSRVLATRTALTTPSAALGMLLGGPVVTAAGARATLLGSSVLTIALGVFVAAVVAIRAPRNRAETRAENPSRNARDISRK